MKNSKQNALAALSRKGSGSSSAWQLSPNDVLVQIALPLVLVLAIIIQLMKIEVENAEAEESYLEPWKQQIILRINHVQSIWADRFGVSDYQVPQDIVWGARFPNDRRFSELNKYSQRLADIPSFREIIYKEALSIDAGELDKDSFLFESLRPVWDSEYSVMKPADMTEGFVYEGEQREFALQVVEDQLANWKQQVESLQWEVVNRVVSTLTLSDPLSDADPATQMQKISNELSSRGYPLLPSVVNEYAEQQQ